MTAHLPVGRLAESLGALSKTHAWLIAGIAIVAIAVADIAIPAVGFAPFYVPLICGTCWVLGSRQGYCVATVTAFLTAVPTLHAPPELSSFLLVLRIMVPISAYLFIAATVDSFRRSYDREQFHAHRDRMTGTLNKEVFHRRCSLAIDNARPVRQTLLLAILDLDDFKAANDSAGHGAGDEIIRVFAKTMSAIMRREDLIGRIGGDEFALLVRVPSIAEGQGVARNIHARLSGVLRRSRYPVTCSMGALLVPPMPPAILRR
ncbi:GGDEF domain-containing protein [Sphingobium fuliginis]|uniref:GGDEF domain-containing protein n=1 Tax=Sphingobium fuliginis (strain ATCC 27551) TaxID=336203 RepID=UPI001FCC05B6|nr:GGDEF domain-containing protein [Sphingobium fuliginis]